MPAQPNSNQPQRSPDSPPEPYWDQPPSAERSRKLIEMRALLEGRSPSEILGRIEEGDPLDIHGRCLRHVRQRAILLDVHRLTARALARVAHAAPRLGIDDPLEEFLWERVEESANELLDDDRHRDVSGLPMLDPIDDTTLRLVQFVKCEPEMARSASVLFNELPINQRSAFFHLVIEGGTIDEYATKHDISREQAMSLVKETLIAMARRASEKKPGKGWKP